MKTTVMLGHTINEVLSMDTLCIIIVGTTMNLDPMYNKQSTWTFIDLA